MRRYTVTVDGIAFTLDVEETAADRFTVTIGDRTLEAWLEAAEDLPGAVITPEMPQPVAWAGPAGGNGGGAAGGNGGAAAGAGVRAAGPPPALSAGATSRAATVVAPMPGVVLEVRTTTGAVVRRGDPLLVLEAMKMRNTIRAPRDATILEIVAEAGRPVAPGEPLVRLGDVPR